MYQAINGYSGATHIQGNYQKCEIRDISTCATYQQGKWSIQNRKNGLDPAAASFAKNPRDGDGHTEGASITPVRYKHRVSTETLDNKTDKGEASLASLYNEVTGSSPTEENKINDILQGLLTCDSKELEGGWSNESFAGETTGEIKMICENASSQRCAWLSVELHQKLRALSVEWKSLKIKEDVLSTKFDTLSQITTGEVGLEEGFISLFSNTSKCLVKPHTTTANPSGPGAFVDSLPSEEILKVKCRFNSVDNSISVTHSDSDKPTYEFNRRTT